MRARQGASSAVRGLTSLGKMPEGAPELRTPSEAERRWAKAALAVVLVLVVAGAIVGGEASGIFFVLAIVPFLIMAYLLRDTLPSTGRDGGGVP